MPSSVFWILIFLISLFVLVKASGYFTDAAEKIGIFFGIPAFVVGITLVTLGTTLPEMVSSIFAVVENSSEIVAGTVVGSNIANIFLVLGLAAVFSKDNIKINYNLLNVDLPLLVGAAFLFAITAWDGIFSIEEAILFLVFFIFYIYYNINKGKNKRTKELAKEVKEEYKEEGVNSKTIIIILISALLIYFGARYTIESVIHLAQIFNVGKEILAVSVIALGTSLPELAVSITAARKGKAEMAVGNVLGANMLNTLGVMGISGMFGSLIIKPSIIYFCIPMMLAATFLYFFITQDKEITKWEGSLLLIFYLLFLGKILELF